MTDIPSTIDQLIEAARRSVGSEDSLNEFVSRMRTRLPGAGHQHVGLLSRMRVQALQNWLLDNNARWQPTEVQLLAVMRVDFVADEAEDIHWRLNPTAGNREH